MSISDEDRLDLSALDPRSVAPERWAAFVDATLARVDAVLGARPRDPLTLIASWTKPLTAGALLAIAVLVPVEIILERREAGAERLERLVELSTETALDQQQPSGAELLRIIGNGGLP